MSTSLQIFIDFFKEFYSLEFPELETEYKNELIEKILTNNGEYITLKMVSDFDGCIKCGRCCEEQGCLDFDAETKLCTRHDNPISDLCKQYPWTGDLGIAPLTINCRYQVDFFINYFDQLFSQKVKDNGETE